MEEGKFCKNPDSPEWKLDEVKPCSTMLMRELELEGITEATESKGVDTYRLIDHALVKRALKASA